MENTNFLELCKLFAGAEIANQHCLYCTNELNAFKKGLEVAMNIVNASNSERAAAIAAEARRKWEMKTGTTPEHWSF